MEKMKNYSLTKYYLSELQRKKLSISEQFACYSISQILEEEISKNCLKSVDFTSIISHEKNVKRFKNNNDLVGVCEVKGYQVRVVFARIDKDTYGLITALVKKQDNDSNYRNFLKKRISKYRVN